MFTIYKSYCRLCLQGHEKTLQSDCVKCNNLCTMIKNIFGFTISPEDKLSTRICRTCVFKVTNFSFFIDTVLGNQKQLKRHKEMEEELSLAMMTKCEEISDDDEDLIFVSENMPASDMPTSEDQENISCIADSSQVEKNDPPAEATAKKSTTEPPFPTPRSDVPTSEDQKSLICIVDSSEVEKSDPPAQANARKSITEPPFPQQKDPYKHIIKKCSVKLRKLFAKTSARSCPVAENMNTGKNNKKHKTSILMPALKDNSNDINSNHRISSSGENNAQLTTIPESAVDEIPEQQLENTIGSCDTTIMSRPVQTKLHISDKKNPLMEIVKQSQTVAQKSSEKQPKMTVDNVDRTVNSHPLESIPQIGGKRTATMESGAGFKTVVCEIPEKKLKKTADDGHSTVNSHSLKGNSKGIAPMESGTGFKTLVPEILDKEPKKTANNVTTLVAYRKPHSLQHPPKKSKQPFNKVNEQFHNYAKAIPCICMGGLKTSAKNECTEMNTDLKITSEIDGKNKTKFYKIEICPPKPIKGKQNKASNPISTNLAENQNVLLNSSRCSSQSSTCHQSTKINNHPDGRMSCIKKNNGLLSNSNKKVEETIKIQSITYSASQFQKNRMKHKKNIKSIQSTTNPGKLKLDEIELKRPTAPQQNAGLNLKSSNHAVQKPSNTTDSLPVSTNASQCTKQGTLNLQPESLSTKNVTTKNVEPKVKVLSVEELNLRAESNVASLPIRVSLIKTKNVVEIKLADTTNREIHYLALRPQEHMLIKKSLSEPETMSKIFAALKSSTPNQYMLDLLQHFGISIRN